MNGRKNILGVYKEVGLLIWMRTAMKDLLEEGTGFWRCTSLGKLNGQHKHCGWEWAQNLVPVETSEEALWG